MTYMHLFFLFSSILCQSLDTSINLTNFLYPEFDDIQIILDEGGENTYFINSYYPLYMDDYSINQILIDGSLQLPQGSYVLSNLFSWTMVPDSIQNISQIHYQKGDFNSSELGLSLQIKRSDGSNFSLQGLKKSPAIIYSSSSWNDNLQNYLLSYENSHDGESVAIDVMYHLENYHLPLSSQLETEYSRMVESFHGGLNIKKKWGRMGFELHPAFQFTNINRSGISTSYLSSWNNIHSKLQVANNIDLVFSQKSKIIMSESDSEINEIGNHIFNVQLAYVYGNVNLRGGFSMLRYVYKPEITAFWKNDNFYFGLEREFYSYLDPVNLIEFDSKGNYLNSLEIGYINEIHEIKFDFFQVEEMEDNYFGISTELQLKLSWLRLYQKGIFYEDINDKFPLDKYNHLSLLFSPNIWFWNKARYQPFIGVESTIIQHTGITSIDPTITPIFNVSDFMEPYLSNIMEIELGIIVNRFKISYLFISSQIFSEGKSNSRVTHPLDSIQSLVIEWQFWN